ncbi:phosphotransferase [Flavobacterium sp.]|uniref:phosphotransferase n=1 Tax=Flavobacterium sp. TaxID=239 RepID=UPI00122512DA|nr:phosphotransferase [Flavobacterium sp.]RZJ69597.1 MAG: homoserine kinase [Flavobacterium sp.]
MKTYPKITATTSTLSESDLEKFAIEKYGLNETSRCKLFRTGINHTYMISDGAKKFVLRVYFKDWKTELEISEEIRLLDLLNENGINVSHAVPDSDGNYIQKLNAPEGLRHAVLFTFGEGDKIRFLNEETCFTIGSVMAKMHKVTSGESLERLAFDEHSLLHSAYKTSTSIFSDALPEVKYLKQTISRISGSFASRKFLDCPSGIVHLDIWYDNMSIRNDREITLFDFDNCGNGKLILDVAYFCKQLFHIESDKEIYNQKVAAFLDAYRSQRSLSDAELAFLPECGAAIFIYYLGMQASRFDWSNIFMSENYLKMYIGRIRAWLDYHQDKVSNVNVLTRSKAE